MRRVEDYLVGFVLKRHLVNLSRGGEGGETSSREVGVAPVSEG